MYETVGRNLLRIQEEIAPCKPRIIAVTKYFDVQAMVCAYRAGLRDFGESRVIEASEKIGELPQEIRGNSQFHFIGHLQTNKVKQAVKTFDYIHSVDSVRLAEKISDCASEIGKEQKVLIEINNAQEEQKYGFSVQDVYENFNILKDIKNLKVVGLMSMAPFGAEEAEIRRLFTQIVTVKKDLEERFNCELKEVSMGMSQDYVIAAQVGATMLRIGKKLFE